MNLQPKYVQSVRGNTLLVHKSFTYTQNGKPIQILGNQTKIRWRCSYKINRRYACTAKSITLTNADGIESVQYFGEHCHE